MKTERQLKSNELRIGNYIQANGPIMEVKSINENEVSLYLHGSEADNWDEEIEKCTGVPLSPEILERCGFIKHVNSNKYWVFYVLDNGFHVGFAKHSEPSAGVREGVCYYGENYIELQYLHQLQNLLYALAGEELILKSIQ